MTWYEYDINRLRTLLKEARQYVADAGSDEDSETQKNSTDLLAEIDAALTSKVRTAMPRYRHKRRGTEYELLGTAMVRTDVPLNDMDEVVIYLSSDGITMLARRKSEFYDGRFEQITAQG